MTRSATERGLRLPLPSQNPQFRTNAAVSLRNITTCNTLNELVHIAHRQEKGALRLQSCNS